MEIYEDKVDADVEKIWKEINEMKNSSDKIEKELLKHYLINYIIYLNLDEEEREDSDIKQIMMEISSLLKNLREGNKYIEKHSDKRIITRKMLKKTSLVNKGKSMGPRQKYRKNASRQSERLTEEQDYSIRMDRKNKKYKKFSD